MARYFNEKKHSSVFTKDGHLDVKKLERECCAGLTEDRRYRRVDDMKKKAMNDFAATPNRKTNHRPVARSPPSPPRAFARALTRLRRQRKTSPLASFRRIADDPRPYMAWLMTGVS